MKCSVLKVELFKRKGSRFWQARIRFPRPDGTPGHTLKRVSTRTVIKASAMQFAELALRHFRKQPTQETGHE